MNPDDGRLRPLPRFIYIVVTVASFSNFCAFYALGLITAALLYIPYSFALNWVTTSAIVTGTLIGGMIGALGAGPMADKIGRRPCHLIGSCLLLFGGIIFTFAPNIWIIVTGRFISGIGIGIITNLANLIIVEMAPAEKRGSLSTIPYFFQFIGTMTPFLVGYLIILALPKDLIPLAWRLMAASGVFVSLVDITAASTLLPESPRWLLFHSKTLEGLALMEKIYGRENHDRLVQEYREIIAAPQGGNQTNASWWEIITVEKYRRPVLVGVALQIIRKLSGNAAVTFYLTLILVESAGLKKSTALLVSLLIYIPDFLVVFGVFRLLDRMGRKLLLFISCSGIVFAILPMAITLTVEGPATGSMSLQEHKDIILNYLQGIQVQNYLGDSDGSRENTIRYIIIASLFLQRCFYSFGLGPVPSIHTAETLPQAVRAKGLGLALFFSWTAAAFITIIFPWALIYLPSGSAYWFFFAVAVIGCPFIFFAVRETANMSIDPVSVVIYQPKPKQPGPNFSLEGNENNFENISL